MGVFLLLVADAFALVMDLARSVSPNGNKLVALLLPTTTATLYYFSTYKFVGSKVGGARADSFFLVSFYFRKGLWLLYYSFSSRILIFQNTLLMFSIRAKKSC